jgi:cobalt transporter subunit CbtA
LNRFRRQAVAALLAGCVAGLLLFAIQHWTVVPLIDRAEGYEVAAHVAEQAHAGAAHVHDEGWEPAPGFERIGLTALATLFSGIGYAAILLAAMTLRGAPIDARRGLLWGLAGFACFVLAPALGLPPKPPGAAVGDLAARQVWWFGTVLATAGGLWLISRPDWSTRVLAVVLLLVPHAIGAPPPAGTDLVPASLTIAFATASVGTNLLFWLALGALCGTLGRRFAPAPRDPGAIPAASSNPDFGAPRH